MRSHLSYADADTPVPSVDWAKCSDAERLARLERAMVARAPSFLEMLMVTAAKQDGQVIVRLNEQLPAHKRGTLLLDLEAFFKEAVDLGLVVWLEVLGDKNSLRNLRGIEVKE